MSDNKPKSDERQHMPGWRPWESSPDTQRPQPGQIYMDPALRSVMRQPESRRRRILVTILKANAALWVLLSIFWALIDFATDENNVWFFYPVLGYGLFVAIHAVVTWALLQAGHKYDAGEVSAHSILPPIEESPTAGVAVSKDPVIAEGQQALAEMRSTVDAMDDPAGQMAADDVLLAFDRVMIAIDDVADEPELAHDFVERLVLPTRQIIRDYEVLSTRGVRSAEDRLRTVRERDLPRITAKADAVHDRIHRGRLIDLDVARELMALDMDDELPAVDENIPKGHAKSQ